MDLCWLRVQGVVLGFKPVGPVAGGQKPDELAVLDEIFVRVAEQESGPGRKVRQELLARRRSERGWPRGAELGKATLHALLEGIVVVQNGRAVEEAKSADVGPEDVGVAEGRGTAGGEKEELQGAGADGVGRPPLGGQDFAC